MKNNRIFNALSGLDDSHFRADELDNFVNIGETVTVKHKPLMKLRIMMIAAAVSAALGISITAGAAVTDGFTKESVFTRVNGYNTTWKRPTVKFSSANSEGCPTVVGETYTPGYLPEGINYEYEGKLLENGGFFANYTKSAEDSADDPFMDMNFIWLYQHTKAEFGKTYETPEYVELKETSVNGCEAYHMIWDTYIGYVNNIIWDNGDYILELQCNVPVEEAMRIAESVRVNENALNGEGLA